VIELLDLDDIGYLLFMESQEKKDKEEPQD